LAAVKKTKLAVWVNILHFSTIIITLASLLVAGNAAAIRAQSIDGRDINQNVTCFCPMTNIESADSLAGAVDANELYTASTFVDKKQSGVRAE